MEENQNVMEETSKSTENQENNSTEATTNNASATENTNSETGTNLTMEEKLAAAEAKAAEMNDKFLRLYSEFDNYKRRTAREKIEFSQIAAKDFFIALLPVIDDFERAMKSIDQANDVQALKEGVDLIYQKFVKTLQSKGLEAMNTKETVFDADLHEALTNIPAPTEELKGKIMDELEKGYYLNGKVIRFAKVVVGN